MKENASTTGADSRRTSSTRLTDNATLLPTISSSSTTWMTTITASTRTVSHRVTKTVKAVTISTGNKAVVEPAVIATLTTQTLPPQTITETYTHSAVYLTTVTTSLLCMCNGSELYIAIIST